MTATWCTFDGRRLIFRKFIFVKEIIIRNFKIRAAWKRSIVELCLLIVFQESEQNISNRNILINNNNFEEAKCELSIVLHIKSTYDAHDADKCTLH